MEVGKKWKKFFQLSLGRAHRISGIPPAAISILMVYLRKRSLEKTRGRKA